MVAHATANPIPFEDGHELARKAIAVALRSSSMYRGRPVPMDVMDDLYQHAWLVILQSVGYARPRDDTPVGRIIFPGLVGQTRQFLGDLSRNGRPPTGGRFVPFADMETPDGRPPDFPAGSPPPAARPDAADLVRHWLARLAPDVRAAAESRWCLSTGEVRHSVGEVAARVGAGENRVSAALKAALAEARAVLAEADPDALTDPRPPAAIRIARRYAAGASVNALAAGYGMQPVAISRILARHLPAGVSRRGPCTAKLGAADVRGITARIEAGEKVKELAVEFGVSRRSLYRAILRHAGQQAVAHQGSDRAE